MDAPIAVWLAKVVARSIEGEKEEELPKTPTVAEIEQTIGSALSTTYPWLDVNVTAERTDK